MAVLAFSQARLRCDGPCQSRSRATSPPSRCPRPSQAEDADRCYSVVGHIDYIVGHEAFNITDDRNCTLLDPARQLFGHASFCLALTDSREHGFLLQRWAAQDRDCYARMFITDASPRLILRSPWSHILASLASALRKATTTSPLHWRII